MTHNAGERTSMKLTQIVAPGAIIPRLAATTRDEAVAELVDALVASGAASQAHRDELIKRVLDRERQASTGFGKGVAVPHVKHEAVSVMRAAIGLSERGVDFASLDRQPVYSIFLLLSPADRPDEHLKAMHVIFASLSKDTFRKFLRQAATVEAVRTLLEEADAHQLAG